MKRLIVYSVTATVFLVGLGMNICSATETGAKDEREVGNNSVIMNTNYFTNLRVSPEGEVVTFSLLYPGTPIPLPIYESPNSKKLLTTCAMSVQQDQTELPQWRNSGPSKKGCGVEVLALCRYQHARYYDFYSIRSATCGDRMCYEVPLKSKGKWGWLSTETLRTTWDFKPLKKWIRTGEGVVLAPGVKFSDLDIRSDAEMDSIKIPCRSLTGDLQNTDGYWVKTACVPGDCDPKYLSPCPKNPASVWVRWLSDDGKILMYPDLQRAITPPAPTQGPQLPYRPTNFPQAPDSRLGG